jgi:hypothetical protein
VSVKCATFGSGDLSGTRQRCSTHNLLSLSGELHVCHCKGALLGDGPYLGPARASPRLLLPLDLGSLLLDLGLLLLLPGVCGRPVHVHVDFLVAAFNNVLRQPRRCLIEVRHTGLGVGRRATSSRCRHPRGRPQVPTWRGRPRSSRGPPAPSGC